ncbi:MAG: hypothetical protein OER56_05220 [Hyphomicrobiales bacterium]|nr:hypothetical protein [Hyphomicrobiales bacterium]
MKIAVIGYGSLIWDLDDLEPKVNGAWQRSTGPAMPVEFARVSPKRKQALVLVIHQGVPAPSATSYIMSNRTSLEQAIEDLAARERTDLDHIGHATRGGKSFSRNEGVAETAGQWLDDTGLDAAVWTDLDGNFDDHTGDAFSHEAGLTYLRTLTGQSLFEAWQYISYAPAETDTPFRRFLSTDSWWNGLDYNRDQGGGW